MIESRRCDICNFNVPGASFAKQLRCKNHLENSRQDDIFIPGWTFQERNEIFNNIPRRTYKPKPSKLITSKYNETHDKEVTEELAEKLVNPFYFTDRILKIAFKITPDSHPIIHIK